VVREDAAQMAALQMQAEYGPTLLDNPESLEPAFERFIAKQVANDPSARSSAGGAPAAPLRESALASPASRDAFARTGGPSRAATLSARSASPACRAWRRC
jgi:hypothetical protein